MIATETVTWAGWICTGRFTGSCRSCKTFLRVESTPRQAHDMRHRCTCGTWATLKQVMGSFKESKTCDARCTTARGYDCECSCGGHNHGADR